MPIVPSTTPPKNWWKFTLVFFLGGAVGGLTTALAMGIATNALTLKQYAEISKQDPNEVIGFTHQEDTIMDVVRMAGDGQFETLGDLNEVFPFIETKLLPQINQSLENFPPSYSRMKVLGAVSCQLCGSRG